MSMPRNPLVSIIIVNYNGKDYLRECLRYVLVSQYDNFEVIVVDNGSTDGSREFVREMARRADKPIMLLANPVNLGPAEARNQSTAIARGEILAFLDNDTKPDPLWLKEAVRGLDRDDVGVVQCKLLLVGRGNLIDSIGCFLGSFGFLVQRVPLGVVEDVGQFEDQIDIFSTKSAGMLIKKTAFEDAGGFDSDYFIYNEEFDLCWRVWLQGYRVRYIPASIVYHESGTTKKIIPQRHSRLLYYHGSKNYILTVIKNTVDESFLKTSVMHICVWLAISIVAAFKGRPLVAKYILDGILWNLRYMKKNMVKRMHNSATKRKSLPRSVVIRAPLRYYFDVFRRF